MHGSIDICQILIENSSMVSGDSHELPDAIKLILIHFALLYFMNVCTTINTDYERYLFKQDRTEGFRVLDRF